MQDNNRPLPWQPGGRVRARLRDAGLPGGGTVAMHVITGGTRPRIAPWETGGRVAGPTVLDEHLARLARAGELHLPILRPDGPALFTLGRVGIGRGYHLGVLSAAGADAVGRPAQPAWTYAPAKPLTSKQHSPPAGIRARATPTQWRPSKGRCGSIAR